MTVSKDQRGFSLIEVALILLIMGIVGIAAIPSLAQARKQEVNELAKEICLDLTQQKMYDGIYTNVYVGQEERSTSEYSSSVSCSKEIVSGSVSSISSYEKAKDYVYASTQNTYVYDGYDLTLNSDKKGYSIIKGTDPLCSKEGKGNIQISIAKTDGTFVNNISTLTYSKGKMTNDLEGAAVPYSVVSIMVRNNQAECIIVYVPATGYYSISS